MTLWHIHLSFYRAYATDMATANNVIDVLLARDSDDMNKDDTMALISQAIQALMYGGNHGGFTQANYSWVHDQSDGIGDRISKLEKPDWEAIISDGFNSYAWGGDHGRFTQAKYAWVKDANHGTNDRLSALEDGK